MKKPCNSFFSANKFCQGCGFLRGLHTPPEEYTVRPGGFGVEMEHSLKGEMFPQKENHFIEVDQNRNGLKFEEEAEREKGCPLCKDKGVIELIEYERKEAYAQGWNEGQTALRKVNEKEIPS